MPIDFNNTITSLSKKTFGSTFLSSLFGNTISISFMISLVVILIIMIMYPAKSGTKFTIFAKMMIYIYFSVLLITFLHDSVVKYKIKEDIERNIEEDSMNNMTTGDNIIYSTKTISPTSSTQQSNIQQTNIQQSNNQQTNNQQSNDNSTDEITIGGALPRVKFGGAPVNIFAL